MKYKWIRKIVQKLPESVRKEREKELRNYDVGNREQIRKKAEESLCRQVMQILILTVIFVILLGVLCVFSFGRDRQIVITRNERGSGIREETLQIRTKEGIQDYTLEVQPKGYKKSELKKAFERAGGYLENHLKGENESLSNVRKALDMPQTVPGENIQVYWSSSDPTLVDIQGNVNSENVKEPVIVRLDAEMESQGMKEIIQIPVCVVPGLPGKKSAAEEIRDALKRKEKESRQEKTFIIPEKISGGTVSKQGKSSRIPTVAFLGISMIIFSWYHGNEKCHKEAKKAKQEAQREYPNIVSRLILYLEAGLSVPKALEEITREYEAKRKHGRKAVFVYEVIGKVSRQMGVGISQKEAFEEIGRQLNLPAYRKLSVLMVQSITKGSGELFLRLRKEEESAFFERKEQAKRQGEEASTKLLAPMIIMLIVILALLMFPALSAF